MKRLLLIVTILAFVYSEGLSASLMLPRIFNNHMVLQRDTHCKIWGWAKPNEKVTLSIDSETAYTYSDSLGKWSAYLPPHKAGGPYTLKVTSDTLIQYNDVMYGEVWFASGQSNMEFRMMDISDGRYDEVVKTSNFPGIRYFKVPRGLSSAPQQDIESGEWEICNNQTINEFSAVAWFFIKKIYDELNVPVAIIESSWGATPAEAWTSQDMLETLPGYRAKALKLDSLPEAVWQQKFVEADSLEALKWSIVRSTDEIKGKYASPEYDDSGWENIELPRNNMTNVVWARKNFNVKVSRKWRKENKGFTLNIGQAYIFQDVYLNGKRLNYEDIRDIRIPAKKINNGKNTLAIRATSPWSNLVHIGKKDALYIKYPDGEILNLEGYWKFSNSVEPPIPKVTYFHQEPAYIFNAMVNPVAGYTMKGAIWYQGESNREYPGDYYELFTTMIQDWRTRWEIGNFPFLFVQLANYLFPNDEPAESGWSEIREAQRKALMFPNTGMAVTIDIGEARNIHPFNKKDVGSRLSRAALNIAYNYTEIAYNGPLPVSSTVEGNKVFIQFDTQQNVLQTKGGDEVKGFALAGEDKQFSWAKVEINGNTVIVSCPSIQNPCYVRYAWGDNPACNLYDSEMLPASPFEVTIKRGK